MTMRTSHKLSTSRNFGTLLVAGSCLLGTLVACGGSDDEGVQDGPKAGSPSAAGEAASAGSGSGGANQAGKDTGGSSNAGGKYGFAGNAPTSEGGAPASEGGASSAGASSAGAAGEDIGGAGGEAACVPEPPQLPSDVPVVIQAPAGTTLLRHLRAVGTQNYRCRASVGPDPTYSWVFVGPAADLLNSCGTKVGSHFAVPGTNPPQPTWRYEIDGSSVTGVKLQDSPVGGAIPELLLAEAGHGGNGVFSTVTFVQRLATQGGLPPVAGCDAEHVDTQRDAGYLADYYFYMGGT